MRETVLDGQNTLSMTLSHIRTTNLHSSYEDLNTPILEPNNIIYIPILFHPSIPRNSIEHAYITP